MIFDKKYETMKREDMQKLQLKRLKKIVKYAYDTIPFYKKKYNEAGFNPESIKSLDDIRRIPFRKDDGKLSLRLLAVHTIIYQNTRIKRHQRKPTVGLHKRLDMWSDCCAHIMWRRRKQQDIVQISLDTVFYGRFGHASRL